MERIILNDLIKWKDSRHRKPLILKGVRQVGKTWALKEFGRRCYENTAYFNFDENAEYRQFFETTKDVGRLLQNLTFVSGQSITPEKTTRQVTFQFEGHDCQGYEIHQGVTSAQTPIVEADRCIGTYIHGILDNAPVIDYLLAPFVEKIKQRSQSFDYHTFKEQQYNLLADHVRQHLDMDKLYQILQGND